MPIQNIKPVNQPEIEKEDICLFAQTNFRNQNCRFGIKTDDRRRHTYVIGKTGMGKTTLMENMVLQDIYNGNGVGVVDPHGDFAEKIINYVPASRINDVVYFNPADTNYPIGFNVLEVKNAEQRHLVTAGLMGIFKKIWPDVWSSRMEYILNNTLAALLECSGSTLLGINRLLAEKAYRARVVRKVTDPVIKGFWQNEFAKYNERYAQEAVAPIQNKIGQFLSASVIRNMVAQVKSTISIREIMDNKKILIMNLSKGRIGEDNSRLLGGMLITKIQLAAMARVDMPESERKDFFLYVDEFQNFATPSFANILSEARKYRLGLIMAHQYVAQLDEVVSDAVFGNVGTIITFRVGGADAESLVREFTPTFTEEDIVNLSKFHIFLKLMIDGVASMPFTATTMPPIGSPTGSAEKVIRVSRERYAKKKEVIEEKILRWSGMAALEDEDNKKPVIKGKKPDFQKKNTGFKTGGASKGSSKPSYNSKPTFQKKDNKSFPNKSPQKKWEKPEKSVQGGSALGGKEEVKTLSLKDLASRSKPRSSSTDNKDKKTFESRKTYKPVEKKILDKKKSTPKREFTQKREQKTFDKKPEKKFERKPVQKKYSDNKPKIEREKPKQEIKSLNKLLEKKPLEKKEVKQEKKDFKKTDLKSDEKKKPIKPNQVVKFD
jgi:hypothetical protein